MEPVGSEEAPPHWLNAPGKVALLVLLQGALGFVIGIAVWYGSGREPSAFLGLGTDDLLVGAATGGALIAAMQALVLAFPRFIGWAAKEQRFFWMHGRRYRPVHILLLSIGAGVGEEALFRGGLQTVFGDHLPAWAAILVAGLLFTLLHRGSRGVFAFIFAYSALFGIVYHATGSLAGVMLAHILFDVWAIAVVQRELVRRGILEG